VARGGIGLRTPTATFSKNRADMNFCQKLRRHPKFRVSDVFSPLVSGPEKPDSPAVFRAHASERETAQKPGKTHTYFQKIGGFTHLSIRNFRWRAAASGLGAEAPPPPRACDGRESQKNGPAHRKCVVLCASLTASRAAHVGSRRGPSGDEKQFRFVQCIVPHPMVI